MVRLRKELYFFEENLENVLYNLARVWYYNIVNNTTPNSRRKKMKTLFKTTDQKAAFKFEQEAQKRYGCMAIYRFQYQGSDGNFYYEILLNPDWL